MTTSHVRDVWYCVAFVGNLCSVWSSISCAENKVEFNQKSINIVSGCTHLTEFVQFVVKTGNEEDIRCNSGK
jgi:hypothetical protein